MAEGFAYVRADGMIEPRTVADTEFAAKVNAVFLLGAQVMPGCPEAELDSFLKAHAPSGAMIRPVVIALREHG